MWCCQINLKILKLKFDWCSILYFPLEYDHEPGIALQQLEFGRIPTTEDILEQYTPVLHRARCSQCGVDYESGRLIIWKSVI